MLTTGRAVFTNFVWHIKQRSANQLAQRDFFTLSYKQKPHTQELTLKQQSDLPTRLPRYKDWWWTWKLPGQFALAFSKDDCFFFGFESFYIYYTEDVTCLKLM